MAKKKTGTARASIGFLIFLLVAAAAYWKRGWVKTQFILAKDKLLARPATDGGKPSNPDKLVVKKGRGEFDGKWPLHRGHRGTVVKSLQTMLNKKHGTGLVVDGIFGKNTEAALIKYGYPKSLDKNNYEKVLRQ